MPPLREGVCHVQSVSAHQTRLVSVIFTKILTKILIFVCSVHNNESTECPDCGKALTISNLNKHIKSVHKKLKKTCDICNEEVPYSSIRLVSDRNVSVQQSN